MSKAAYSAKRPQNDAAVPFGLRVAFAGLTALSATLGGEGQDHKGGLLGAGAARFGVLAEESDESDSILMQDAAFRFCSRSLSGHPKASGAAPKDKGCFFGGTAKA